MAHTTVFVALPTSTLRPQIVHARTFIASPGFLPCAGTSLWEAKIPFVAFALCRKGVLQNGIPAHFKSLSVISVGYLEHASVKTQDFDERPMALVVRLIGLVVDDLAHPKVVEKLQARIAWPMRHVHYSVAPV